MCFDGFLTSVLPFAHGLEKFVSKRIKNSNLARTTSFSLPLPRKNDRLAVDQIRILHVDIWLTISYTKIIDIVTIIHTLA